MIRDNTRAGVIGPVHQKYIIRVTSLGLLLLLTTSGASLASGATAAAYFTEPGTGHKVTSYSVDLPVSDTREQRFVIPGDCDSLNDSITTGQRYRGRVLGRRLWMKAEQDCRYHALLRRNRSRVAEDYVSNFDFMNMQLDQLPYEANCETVVKDTKKRSCNPQITGTFGKRLFFVPTQESRTISPLDDAISCRFEAGILRGRIHSDGDSLYCVDDGTSSLRILGVDYSDVNGDDVLDAVLRLAPLGTGISRRLLVLPVTRLTPEGPLEAIQAPLNEPTTRLPMPLR